MDSSSSSQLAAAQFGRKLKSQIVQRVDGRIQPGNPLAQFLFADVRAVPFQQIVGHQDYGHGQQDFGAEVFAADALLQRREVERPTVLPGQDLAVDHRAVRQRFRRRRDFGELVGDELFAPRPDKGLPASSDDLGADPVPLPLGLPFSDRPQIFGRSLQRVRQEERVGPTDIRITGLG